LYFFSPTAVERALDSYETGSPGGNMRWFCLTHTDSCKLKREMGHTATARVITPSVSGRERRPELS